MRTAKANMAHQQAPYDLDLDSVPFVLAVHKDQIPQATYEQLWCMLGQGMHTCCIMYDEWERTSWLPSQKSVPLARDVGFEGTRCRASSVVLSSRASRPVCACFAAARLLCTACR